MRALLVVNQQATTTSERSRDVLIRALRSAVELDIAYTRRRNHATALAQAAAGKVDLVVVHGGDGTVNEVVNGLMADGGEPASTDDPARRAAVTRPALAVVPGGSTNVFARALGLPRDWGEATGVILEAVRERRVRMIGLGRADERYFTFCAGLGIDAAVVRRVERARMGGRPSTPGLYLRATAGQLMFARDRRRADITVEVTASDLEPDRARMEHLATVIVQNTAPWTYLGDRPIDASPDASFDLGLDVLAMRTLRVPGVARTIGQMLARRGTPHGAQVVRWHDLSQLTLYSASPQPFQVDGDYLGERAKVQFTAVPEALRVLC
jgi:diacylglycerol kinase family enzyme